MKTRNVGRRNSFRKSFRSASVFFATPFDTSDVSMNFGTSSRLASCSATATLNSNISLLTVTPPVSQQMASNTAMKLM